MTLAGLPFVVNLHDVGTDPRCIVSWENYMKGIFLGPQALLSFLAMIFGFIVLCNLTTPALR